MNTALGIFVPISILTVISLGADEPCESGWFPIGGHCYMVIPKPHTFNEAKTLCENSNKNGTMAELETKAEKNNLVSRIRTTYEITFTGQLFWVGAQGKNASFYWNSGHPVTYDDYVDGIGEDDGCLAFGTTTSERFKSVNCTENHIVICEMR